LIFAQALKLRQFLWDKHPVADFGYRFGALARLNVHTHLSAFGNQADRKAERIGKIEAQAAVRFYRRLAIGV
jgi:hypothetical protein